MQTDSQVAIPGEPVVWIERALAELIERALWILCWLPFLLGVVWSISMHGIFCLLALAGFVFAIGAWVFLAMRYRNGQSMGKRLMGMRVVLADGQPPTWAYNFLLREFLIKGILMGFASSITFGIFPLVNYLWPLWDARQQTLHDKMMGTFVIRVPRQTLGEALRSP